MVAPSRAPLGEVESTPWPNSQTAMFVNAFALLFVALVIWTTRRQGQVHLKLQRVRSLFFQDKEEEARAILNRFVAPGVPHLTRASARTALASLDEKHAKFAVALETCEAALADAKASNLDVNATLLVLPTALAERARLFCLLAVEARTEKYLRDAETDIRVLLRDYPEYAYLPGAIHRVQMGRAIARRAWSQAAAVARARGLTIPLDYRDDMLCEMILAATSDGTTDDDRHALLSELDADEVTRRWLEAAAPGVLDAVRSKTRLVDRHRVTDDRSTRSALPEEDEDEEVAAREEDDEADTRERVGSGS
jgi:hypothetical protein